ncbi:5,10-methylenetetrahydrofolate reductase [Candidatus Endolissoclinum faulkneri L2]|uniref:Methylenetetrahydrofolate reductase n=1 Tax=Candidatus Endolissoclinum faulkneri L2 TaxID=1193729 RepID=K7Z3F5_9PROT|nr:methylenetetrahydrofolate reductase [NAD(P)H] [Candidatus Endolissoclinum faulkneri]AFX98498.1 5,10-methylenetetrahydrofolate reductase [Candidatus Endolissoclinum faulkneri L2]
MFNTPNVSFEFFPPKDEEGEANLLHTVSRLEPYRPSFASVTYGAGGSTRERTNRIVKRLVEESTLTPAAHLTCVGATREEINSIVRTWQAAGIKHIVALRGDAPAGAEKYEPHPNGYANAAELTAGLRKMGDFEISVGAYPDVHPDSPSAAADLENLKRKIDEGANRAITQYFFEADTFLRFRDVCTKAGIKVPIVPGILPVVKFKTVLHFSKSCGAVIPQWMADLFDGLDEDPEISQLVAAATATELCMKLMTEGVEDFHFYTLNRSQLTSAICRRLGRKPNMKDTT